MKHLYALIGIVFAIFVLPLQVMAAFEMGHLTQVVYKNDDVEVGKDLLNTTTFDFSQQNVQVAPAGTFSLNQFQTTNNWADLQLGFFAYRVGSDFGEAWFATTKPTLPTIRPSSLGAFFGGSGPIGTYYNNILSNGVAIGDPAYQMSYWYKLDSHATPGQYAGYNGDFADGEASLAALGTGGYVDMYLYKFNLSQPLAGPGGTPYMAILRVKADGSTILNPSGSGGGQAPVIGAIEDASVVTGSAYTGPTPSLTQGSGTVVWTLAAGPSGMTIDAGTGVVSWSNPTTAGTPHTITIHAEISGQSDEETWQLTVSDTALSPLIAEIVNQSAGVGSAYSGPTPVLGQGSQPVTWALVSGPAGMTINSASGVVAWANPSGDASPYTVTLRATNSAGSDEESWVLTVSTAALVIDAIADTACSAGIAYNSHAPTLSQGSPPVVWSLVSRPAGMTINSVTGVVTWISPIIEGSPYTVTLRATNDAGFAEKSFQLTVIDGALLPEIAEILSHTTLAGKPYSGPLPSLAAGTQPVNWILVTGPTGLEINADTGVVAWSSAVLQLQPYTITIRATNAAGSDDQTWEVTVTNRAPTEPSVNYPPHEGETNVPTPQLSVNNATDPDGHPLTYDFKLFEGEIQELIAEAEGLAEGQNTTSWAVNVTLEDNQLYSWRARAYDGYDYSPWIGAEFFVNTVNDAPSAPAISQPADDAGVNAIQPLLEVTNASDPDRDALTYEFEVYRDEALTHMVTSASGIASGTEGSTSWTVDTELQDEASYWWRVRARDDEGLAGEWSQVGAFHLTVNFAPTALCIQSPADQGETGFLDPDLTVLNATDQDADPLSYFFEVDRVNTFDSPDLQKSLQIAETSVTTAWQPQALTDDTTWHWRVRAFDGEVYSDWVQGSFFVNLINDAPTTPTILSPTDHARVGTTTPTLTITPATDEDNDYLTYAYELYADAQATALVASEEGAETSWMVLTGLSPINSYHWRVRSVDEHGAKSDWTDLSAFFIDVNAPPMAPVINNPVSGGTVVSLSPVLSVINATDLNTDSLRYEFELFSDPDLFYYVASDTVEEGAELTSWAVPVTLKDRTIYYWRARAQDGQLAGSWTPTAGFKVNTGGIESQVEIITSQPVSAAAQQTQTVIVSQADSPLFGLTLEIPPGALPEDCTVTIGIVANPPALEEGKRSCGKVIYLGPSGMSFNAPVKLMIPLTPAFLAAAGTEDPSEIEIYVYNSLESYWEQILTSTIWERTATDGQVETILVAPIEHFSMFSTARTVTDGSGDGSSGSGGGGGGGCFIETLTSP